MTQIHCQNDADGYHRIRPPERDAGLVELQPSFGRAFAAPSFWKMVRLSELSQWEYLAQVPHGTRVTRLQGDFFSEHVGCRDHDPDCHSNRAGSTQVRQFCRVEGMRNDGRSEGKPFARAHRHGGSPRGQLWAVPVGSAKHRIPQKNCPVQVKSRGLPDVVEHKFHVEIMVWRVDGDLNLIDCEVTPCLSFAYSSRLPHRVLGSLSSLSRLCEGQIRLNQRPDEQRRADHANDQGQCGKEVRRPRAICGLLCGARGLPLGAKVSGIMVGRPIASELIEVGVGREVRSWSCDGDRSVGGRGRLRCSAGYQDRHHRKRGGSSPSDHFPPKAIPTAVLRGPAENWSVPLRQAASNAQECNP